MQNANLTLFICCNVLPLLDYSIGYSPCFKAKNSDMLHSYPLLLPANDVWGKVMFLHLSVNLFTGGEGGLPRRVCIQGGRHVGGVKQNPPPAELGKKAGGTYPTGMLSCFLYYIWRSALLLQLCCIICYSELLLAHLFWLSYFRMKKE